MRRQYRAVGDSSRIMSRKTIIMIGMAIGSYAGAYVTTLFGASMFSFTALIGSAIGGFAGIWIAFKLTE
jgi:phage tail tape-measure protein